MRRTFSAYERLKREGDIDALFRHGKAHSVFPVRFVSLAVPRQPGERSAVRAGFSAPKRRFRRAHDRARIKRLLREAWRHHKHELAAAVPEELQLHLFLLYTGTELPELPAIEVAVTTGIGKLIKAGFVPPAPRET